MDQHFIASLIYLVITVMFSFNLKNLYKKFRAGKTSSSTILATISLVVTFLGLTFYFASDHIWIVIAAQIYLIGTMLYIKFFTNKK
jgi:NAD/NADP transhydrogenase beta subunit